MAKNNYFQFKQFRIEQENAAMKVGTDGVLLGAWAEVENATSILDIGTGTGLIALMIAQRSNAQIDAIDIEADAVKDAKLNFNNSKWNNRLNVFHSSLQDFATTNSSKYDCIVCNPPFFSNGDQSKKQGRSIARHTISLSFKDLLDGIIKLLNKDGWFSVVLPFDSKVEFIATAQQLNLFCSKIVDVKPKPSKPAKRVLMEFKFSISYLVKENLTIETEIRHVYTPEFNTLANEYYLYL